MQNVTEITVFVASPGDVGAERTAITGVIKELNLDDSEPIRINLKKWETHTWPGFGQDAQDVINGQIGGYDIFVGIFWNRLGTPTKRAKSGTVEEFNLAYQSWLQHKRPSLLFYFKVAPALLERVDELKQKMKVVDFKQELRKLGAYTQDFGKTSEFRTLIDRHLRQEIKKILRQAASPPPAPVPAAPPAAPDDGGLQNMQKLVKKLGYRHLGLTRNLLDEIEKATAEAPLALRKQAISGLMDFLMTAFPEADEETVKRVRAVRRESFRLIRQIADSDITGYLSQGELEAIDLAGLDFSRMELAKTNFRNCFAIEADFRGAKLEGATFEGARIRNADFADASLGGVDLTDADWFSALNLTEAQLRSVKRGTLTLMPATEDECHALLKKRYGLPFSSWTEDVQHNLTSAWKEYGRRGGLASVVAKL